MNDSQQLTANLASCNYRGADKSLVETRRKNLQRKKVLMFIYLIVYHNGGNIVIIYIYNKTSIKRNILTTTQNTLWSRSGYGLISTPPR